MLLKSRSAKRIQRRIGNPVDGNRPSRERVQPQEALATLEAGQELLQRISDGPLLVVAAAQSGRHANGRHTYGDSMIVDSWGRVQARRAHGDGVIIADLDLDRQRHIRASFPALAHRRGDLMQ